VSKTSIVEIFEEFENLSAIWLAARWNCWRSPLEFQQFFLARITLPAILG